MKRKLIVCFFLLLLLTLQYSCREGNSNNRIQEVEETRSRTCSPNSSTSFLENYNFDLETNDAILISTDEFGTEFRDNAFINLRFIYRNGKLIIYNNRTVLYNR